MKRPSLHPASNRIRPYSDPLMHVYTVNRLFKYVLFCIQDFYNRMISEHFNQILDKTSWMRNIPAQPPLYAHVHQCARFSLVHVMTWHLLSSSFYLNHCFRRRAIIWNNADKHSITYALLWIWIKIFFGINLVVYNMSSAFPDLELFSLHWRLCSLYVFMKFRQRHRRCN